MRPQLLGLLAVLATSAPAHAQDECLPDHASLFAGPVAAHANFRAVYADLARDATYGGQAPLETPATEGAARAAMCTDGTCSGAGPWLVLVSNTRGQDATFVWAIVARYRGRLYIAYGDRTPTWVSVRRPSERSSRRERAGSRASASHCSKRTGAFATPTSCT